MAARGQPILVGRVRKTTTKVAQRTQARSGRKQLLVGLFERAGWLATSTDKIRFVCPYCSGNRSRRYSLNFQSIDAKIRHETAHRRGDVTAPTPRKNRMHRYDSAIHHLQIAHSWIDEPGVPEPDWTNYVFAMTEIGYALLDLPNDSTGGWLVKEDFYQMSAALVSSEKDRKEHFLKYLNKAIERLKTVADANRPQDREKAT